MKKNDPIKQPRIFISYSSKDVEVVEQIHLHLEKSAGFEVWRDKNRIEQDWSREIAFALASSDIICLIWSENSDKSKYVLHEWLTAWALEKSIIICRLGKYKNYPKPLHNLQDVKFSDLRKGNKELTEKIKNIRDFHVKEYEYSILPENNYIPFNPNRQFTGRHMDLLELYLKMIGNLNNIGINQVGTIGMGGIGKTQLAVEFAYRFSFAYDGVFWIQAADTDRWLSQFVELARDRLQLSISDPEKPQANRQYIYARQKYCNENPQMLIIMDNVSDPKQLNNDTFLFGLTPLTLRCNLLFTTRKHFRLNGVTAQAVDVLSTEGSYTLLTKYREPDMPDEAQHARAICNAVGFLPLAIVLAGSYLKEYSEVSFADYHEELLKNKLDVIDIGEVSQEELSTRHIAAVGITLQEDWKRLENENARHLFRLIGQFGEAEIVPKARLGLLAAIQQGKSKLHRPLDKAFNLLHNHSLVERIGNDAWAVRLHPLVREFANNLIQEDKQEIFKTNASDNLRRAYLNYSRLKSELETRGVNEIIEDLQIGITWCGKESKKLHDLNLLQSSLRLSTHVVAKYPDQLASQLTGRLIRETSKEVTELLNDIILYQDEPWLRPYSSGLIPAGGTLRRTLSGMNCVSGVIVAPDDSFALCHDDDSIIWIWDLHSGELKRSIETSRSWINCSAVHPTKPIAVAAKEDGGILVIDMVTAEILRELPSNGDLNDVTLSLDGLLVWSVHKNGVVESRPLDGSTNPREIDIGWEDIEAITSSIQDHAFLAVGSSIEEWNLVQPNIVRKIEGHTDSISALALSTDGLYLAVGFDDGSIDLWNLSEESRLSLTGHKEQNSRNIIAALEFTPQGDRLISASWDQTLRVWDIPGGHFSATLEGHSASVYSVAMFRNGTRTISSSKDGTLRIWDLTVNIPSDSTFKHKAGVDALAVRGKTAVSGSRDRVICVWDLFSGRDLHYWEAHEGKEPHEGWIQAVAIDPSGVQVHSAGSDRFLRTWNLADGKRVNAIRGDWGSSRAMALSDNGNLLASADGGYSKVKLSFWQPGHMKKLGTVVVERSCSTITVSADGAIVIAGDMDGGFDVVDTHKLKVLWSKRGKKKLSYNYPESIAINPAKTRAIFGFSRGYIEVWDLDKKAKLSTFSLHSDRVSALAFSPDSILACSASWDRTLQVWEIKTGKLIAAFSSDDFWCSCTFAGDSSRILAGDEFGCVHFLYLEGLGIPD